MTPTMAIKKYLEKEGTKVQLQEMSEFLKSITPEEKAAYAKVAAKELGEELTEEPK